jgi:hypothetical protein
MVVVAPEVNLWVAQKLRIVTAKSIQFRRGIANAGRALD